MRKHAVNQQASANLHRLKHPGIRAAGAHRIDQRTGMKHRAFAGGEIRGGDRQRNPQFFKSLHFQNAVEKPDHALVAGKPVARERPAGNVLEAHPGGHLLEFRRRKPAAVSRADERTHTGAGNISDRDIFFFENLQDTYVGNATSEAAAERQANANLGGITMQAGRMFGQLASKRLYRTYYPAQTLHGTYTPGSAFWSTL